jgi:hypothetical protein
MEFYPSGGIQSKLIVLHSAKHQEHPEAKFLHEILPPIIFFLILDAAPSFVNVQQHPILYPQ